MTVQPDRAVVRRIRAAALIGAVAGMPLAYLIPAWLWSVEQFLKPGPSSDIELSAMAMSVVGLLIGAVLFGPPIGAAVGAAWAASRLGYPRVAARWCLVCGSVTALALIGVLWLQGGNVADQFRLMLLPWRGGHLLWSLLLTGWGAMRSRNS